MEWKERDPLIRLQQELIAEGEVSEGDIVKIKNVILETINEAVAFAKSSPFPVKEELGRFIYADDQSAYFDEIGAFSKTEKFDKVGPNHGT